MLPTDLRLNAFWAFGRANFPTHARGGAARCRPEHAADRATRRDGCHQKRGREIRNEATHPPHRYGALGTGLLAAGMLATAPAILAKGTDVVAHRQLRDGAATGSSRSAMKTAASRSSSRSIRTATARPGT